MVDIRKALDEAKAKIAEGNDIDSVSLRLICANIIDHRGEPDIFWVKFEDDESLSTLNIGSGGVQDNADLNASATFEEEVAAYGKWYEILSDYYIDIDEFRDVPIDEGIKALELIDFSSYEIRVW